MIQKKYFKTKNYCKVKFVLDNQDAKTATILGLNNDWQNPISMTKKKDGTFTCDVTLLKDLEHQFKYLVNEAEWLNDSDADAHLPNIFGGTNSVLVL